MRDRKRPAKISGTYVSVPRVPRVRRVPPVVGPARVEAVPRVPGVPPEEPAHAASDPRDADLGTVRSTGGSNRTLSYNLTVEAAAQATVRTCRTASRVSETTAERNRVTRRRVLVGLVMGMSGVCRDAATGDHVGRMPPAVAPAPPVRSSSVRHAPSARKSKPLSHASTGCGAAERASEPSPLRSPPKGMRFSYRVRVPSNDFRPTTVHRCRRDCGTSPPAVRRNPARGELN